MKLMVDDEVIDKIRPLERLVPELGKASLYELMEPTDLHIALNAFNQARMLPSLPSPLLSAQLPMFRAAEQVEAAFIEQERTRTSPQVADVPTSARKFVAWFEDLRQSAPGQFDPLFDYLAERADRSEITYFIKQEYCGEVGFDDLIAMTLVRLPERAKLELARNFWDEQGCGVREDLHGPMYSRMAHELGVRDTPDHDLVWETLAVANLLTGLASNRRYTWHSMGALSAIELTSPTRAVRVARGLERVGVSNEGCRYFRLHTTIDVEHWDAWREEVVIPLVSETPELAVPLAEGAFMRLNSGLDVINRYRAELALDKRFSPSTQRC